MPKTLAILHTTPVTISALGALVEEYLPGCTVYNFLDDSILPHLIAGMDPTLLRRRIQLLLEAASLTNPDGIVSACSSIGRWVVTEQERYAMPLFRIDQAMARLAVEQGTDIGVLATLHTTLGPTTELIEAEAATAGRTVRCSSEVVAGAYECLRQGNHEEHDRLIAESMERLASQCDILVLAQASMARAAELLPDLPEDSYLTSPRLGIAAVRDALLID